MLILKYFLTVGLALTAGLWLLSSYLESQNASRTARIQATTATLPIAKPAVAAIANTDLDVMVGPHKPDKPAKAQPRHSTQPNRDGRRAVH